MKIERSKNAIRNIISGMVNKSVSLLLPFLVRTILINTLGIGYLGLNSLFTSVLNVLNLAELGVGSAIIFHLYRAIAEDDSSMICALMEFYKKIYLVIGVAVSVIGLCLLPFISYMCSKDIPSGINLSVLFLMYLLNTVSTYFLFAYKSCLLTAYQRVDITNNINTLLNLILYTVQIFILLLWSNYYIYVLAILIATCLNNLLNAYYATKKYSEYTARGQIKENTKKDIFRKVKAIFLYKIGGVVLTSVDSIVISAFLGLTVLGKYNSYYYVITTLFGFLQVYYNAMTAGIGNSIATESTEKNRSDFQKLQFIQSWIVGWCTVCLICLYQPFMRIWVGVSNMFPTGVVISLAVYFYLWKMMDIIHLYKEASGLWEYDKYRPLTAAFINLILNIIMVNVIGIYGIILSTIVAILFIILPWSVYVIYKYYFKRGIKKFIIEYAANTMFTVFIGFITYGICLLLSNDIWSFLVKCLVCLCIPNFLFFVIYQGTERYQFTRQWLLRKIKEVPKR